MKRSVSVLVLLLALCGPLMVWGHGYLKSPTARSGVRDTKYTPYNDAVKLATCGNDPDAKPIVATYTEGQEITVTWEITIPHTSAPGVRIALKKQNSDSFDAGTILVSGLEASTPANTRGDYSATVKLPAGVTCESCVLQWVWQSQSDGGFYIGCADVTIKAGDGPTPVPTSFEDYGDNHVFAANAASAVYFGAVSPADFTGATYLSVNPTGRTEVSVSKHTNSSAPVFNANAVDQPTQVYLNVQHDVALPAASVLRYYYTRADLTEAGVATSEVTSLRVAYLDESKNTPEWKVMSSGSFVNTDAGYVEQSPINGEASWYTLVAHNSAMSHAINTLLIVAMMALVSVFML